jgi:predicted  nucleic acid-binding Zn-ribbon protein
MNEQELSEMAVLEQSAQSLTGRFKEYHVKLEQVAAELALDREKLNGREKELNEREMKITRREAEVGTIRQIAADRRVQVEVAQAASTKANEMRKKAETELRLAKDEKTQLESVLAGLLKEKNELAAQLAQAQKPAEVQA